MAIWKFGLWLVAGACRTCRIIRFSSRQRLQQQLDEAVEQAIGMDVQWMPLEGMSQKQVARKGPCY